MVRKSYLVYDLLRSQNHPDGFSRNEIFNQVSEIHNITPGKSLRKQINVALRRGIDFGILTRQHNKYIYDVNSPINTTGPEEKRSRRRRRRRVKRKSKVSSKARPRRRNRVTPSSRKQSPEIPLPRVPPPPNWNPKRRNIREEPVPKFIKHPTTPQRPS